MHGTLTLGICAAADGGGVSSNFWLGSFNEFDASSIFSDELSSIFSANAMPSSSLEESLP